MESIEDKEGASTPEARTLPEHALPEQAVPQQVNDNAYATSDYTYGTSQPGNPMPFAPTTPPKPVGEAGGGMRRLPPPPGSGDGGGGEDDEPGMLRMSFLEHLEELRVRLFYAVAGFGVAFVLSLTFCHQLWDIVSQPAVAALTSLGIKPPNLTQITPMEGFNVIWVKVPCLTSIFLASPWLLYQVWAFVSPGLYKREKKWAVPFVVSTAGLFITGGLFAYFVAFRFGLTFLLGVGRDVHVTPMVSINEYFDLFVNVTLGIGLVFEMPILIFFLTLLRIVTPQFLIRNSRYAILIITIIAAVVTPTPDVFNLLLFATPMILLFFVGVFASYLLMLSREGKKFPWAKVLLFGILALILLGGIAWLLLVRMHFVFVGKWPFLVR
jgi:sec-independent protein translocase protein TatC